MFLFCQQIWVNNNFAQAMGANHLTCPHPPPPGGGKSDHHIFIQRGPILKSDPYPFTHHFWQKRHPSLSTAVNEMNKSQKKKVWFLDFFTALKCFICGHFGPFYGPKWLIFLTFHILQLVKSLPFHMPGPWKRYPFRAEPPGIGHCRAQWGWDSGLRVSRKCSSFKKYFDQYLLWFLS